MQQQQQQGLDGILRQLQEVTQAQAQLRQLMQQLEQLGQSLQQQLLSYQQQQEPQSNHSQQVTIGLGQLASLLGGSLNNSSLSLLQQQNTGAGGGLAQPGAILQPAARLAEQGGESDGARTPAELKQDDDEPFDETLPEGSYDVVEPDAIEIMAEHTHFCEICHKGFKRDANLRMHMRGHGDEYKTAAALQKPGKDNQDAGDVRPKRYSCPYVGCKRNRKHPKFQHLKTMLCVKNHYRRSHCPKVLSCSKCGLKKFSVVADLKTHEKHCGRDKWMCSCRTTFSRKDKLLGHLALFAGHTPLLPLHMMENVPSASTSTATPALLQNSVQSSAITLAPPVAPPTRDFQTSSFLNTSITAALNSGGTGEFNAGTTGNFLSKFDNSSSALQSLYRELSLPLGGDGSGAGSSQLPNLN